MESEQCTGLSVDTERRCLYKRGLYKAGLVILTMALSLIILWALMLQGTSGLTLLLGPSDTARELGKNATLACIVTNTKAGESVQWKHRRVGSDAFNALTFNENVLADPTKYAVTWTYNLTVINVDVSDAGLYRCTAGTSDYDATLTVVDLPRNVSVELVGEPVNGETHNVTCRAQHALPPPQVTWSVGGVDMSSHATVVNKTDDSGYGNITSYLPLSLTESMNGKGVECVLSYRGWQGAMKATYTLQTIYPGGYANQGTGFFNPAPIVIPGTSRNYSTSAHQANGRDVPRSGVFMMRFLKQSVDENINWEIQQYKP